MKSKLTIDHEMFKANRNKLKWLREHAKCDYIQHKLSTATSIKDTYSILNKLLHKPIDQQLPSYTEPLELADRFATFFEDKIAKVRLSLNNNAIQPLVELSNQRPCLDQFSPTDVDELCKLLSKSSSKSCPLDPAPTWLIKQCPAIVPILCKVINNSLSSGIVPASLKHALITPALKKSTLDRNLLKNYRPISNLPFVAKLTERVVSKRLESHCRVHDIGCHFQSAYKQHHSTETALVRVQNDLLMAVDSLGGAILILLDLSAAFDTIDHTIMLNRLRTSAGISEKALDWFQSYLSNRS
jgi:hypothetical protein